MLHKGWEREIFMEELDQAHVADRENVEDSVSGRLFAWSMSSEY